MMKQYREAKEAYPGMLLLFRMGDFFELFGEDASLAARELGLTLTSRDKQIAMAGFPHHQLEMYLKKLLSRGYRVAVCDQVEDAAQAKGLVKREVTRVVTAGTVTEDELLDPAAPNFLAAVVRRGNVCGLAWVDLSAGSFCAADIPSDRLADEVARLSPAECLHAESDREAVAPFLVASRTVSPRPDWTFDPVTARKTLLAQFRLGTTAGLGFDDDQPAVSAAGSLVAYLNETFRSNLGHLQPPRPHVPESYLALDEVTRRSLELTRTLRDGGREGSLLHAIDRTTTAMGARLLHEWLLQPLTDREAIAARHDAVEALLNNHGWRNDLRVLLESVADLHRLTARASAGRATPKDLALVAQTLGTLPALRAALADRPHGVLPSLGDCIDPLPELKAELDRGIADSPPFNPKDGGVIRDGFDARLDELRSIARDGKSWIARYQADEVARSGIASLKVGYNQVFGYYIEVTHANAGRVPADYVRKQTLKNAERYVTPELKEYEEKVLGAEEKIRGLEFELFVGLRDRVAAAASSLRATADALAALDVLAGLAALAAERGYERPTMVDEPTLAIKQGRHPVLDQSLPPGTFVPNDVDIGSDAGRLWLITGPNMAGKSIFIRQVALLTLLAQSGSFVPAESATVGIADRIFTRVGAADELNRGQSTFMVEMVEAANILNNATPRSLVILDEIGRGTSTYDGVSLAWSIAEYLHDVAQCRTLFATHYHELAQLSETLPELRNYTVQVIEDAGSIVFVHRVAPGSATKSYGIHVARLAGVPAAVLDRARTVLDELESHHKLNAGKRPKIPARPRRAAPPERKPAGPSLFGEA
ncbi:MAG: DNA mismatch repair protein MutS [Gemmataceae bacterium]|nr:DNA mismatch repair protein MutS [Gemmataceae bacterium]